MFDTIYLCDAAHNTACTKEMCYLNDGPCECTTDIRFAKELTPMLKLDDMMDRQSAFQTRLDPNFYNMSVEERVAFIKEHSIHLNQEINEMLYELPYFKPWKDYSSVTAADAEVMLEKARMECVDAWHFFMNIMLALGFSSNSFYTMYVAKNKENHRRQDDGYTADKSYREQTVEEVMNNG